MKILDGEFSGSAATNVRIYHIIMYKFSRYICKFHGSNKSSMVWLYFCRSPTLQISVDFMTMLQAIFNQQVHVWYIKIASYHKWGPLLYIVMMLMNYYLILMLANPMVPITSQLAFWKRSALRLHLTLIFQAFLDQGIYFARRLEAGHSCSCFRKGRRTDPCNYIPISLICICNKLLEHIVYSNIS